MQSVSFDHAAAIYDQTRALPEHVAPRLTDALLAELRRVIAPGGVLLHDRTRYDEDNPWQRLFGRRAELLGALGYVPRPRPSPEEIASTLESHGATLRTVGYAEDDVSELARDVLARARNRVDSWTWEVPDAIFGEFFSRFEAVVERELGGLDVQLATHVRYTLEVWSFP